MLDFPTWRKVWLWLITGLCVAAALPSLLSATSVRWPDALPDPMVNLGLDLAGGSHILLEADAAQVGLEEHFGRLPRIDIAASGGAQEALHQVAQDVGIHGACGALCHGIRLLLQAVKMRRSRVLKVSQPEAVTRTTSEMPTAALPGICRNGIRWKHMFSTNRRRSPGLMSMMCLTRPGLMIP